MSKRFVNMIFALTVVSALTQAGFAQEQAPTSQGSSDVLVREVEYVSPLAAATPCPTAEPGKSVNGCVDPDPRDAQKAFKMNVPADWDVRFNDGVNALYMEPKNKVLATPENPVVADPNITVKVTKNPIPVDEKGLEEFAEDIEQGLNRTEQGVESSEGRIFKVFNKTFVNLPMGQRAYFYYVQGAINGIPVRQAVLVASTQQVRYRITLTDSEQNFDKSLERYFSVLTSLQLSGAPLERPSTFVAVLPWLLVFIGIVGIFLGMKILRLRNTRQLIQEVEFASDAQVSQSPTTSSSNLPDSHARVSKSSNTEYPPFDD